MPTTDTRGGETNTIIPYLFGGLGLLLALIAVALVTLACSSRKKRHPPDAAAKLGGAVDDHQPAAPEVPRIVVIMAGDDKPTFLATAAPMTWLRWNSPTPYLFIGIILLLGLIAAALVILACSFRKRPSPSASDDDEWAVPGKRTALELDPGPKIVVIMAGDDKPTYLAKPVPPNHGCRCGSQV
ncbi:hypothetical protein Cgig2_034161 [Carnegiea gigantea]|uniref:Transmembrane protein n=1 Tax=Carnegiea gigantea TaxID=171969 RepID=A0A9Q1JTN3_9CARY|nr:hypothetical protein Cgig2_034161 [Carnegiea gigantea]